MVNQNQESGSGQQTINIQVPSADNIASRRSLIPVLFAAIIIFFFFNFFTVSCGGQKIGSVTGINLVTGTELKDRDMFSGRETKGEKIPSSAWAIISFGAAIIGLGAFLIKEKREAIIGTGAGAIGFVSLIILQFAIKSAIEKKAEGAIQTDFQFAYWGALIAMGIAGFISYLRMQKTYSIVVTVVPPSPPATPNTENITQPLASINPIQQANNIDIGVWLNKSGKILIEWFSRNKIILISIASAIIVLYGVYYFFLRHDPVKDGKIAATAACDCFTKNIDEKIKVNEEFVKSFESYGFKKRQEARNKLQEMQNSVDTENTTCINASQQKFNDLRNRYIAKQEMVGKFDFTYNSQFNGCNPSNQSKFTSLYSDVENKIISIIDPEPDIEKIKTDLIGQQIPGWRFAYLSEYQSADILSTTRGSTRAEYQIKFQLIDKISNSQHDCEVVAVYLLGDQGWYFNDVRMIYITYTSTAPLNSWFKITPLKNCRYSILDQGHNYWAQDGYWGKKYQAGPNEAGFNLTSSEIYIMSRESQPVDIVFKYFPNN